MKESNFVCNQEDLPPGERKVVQTDKGTIGVFNVDGNLYALENTCAHEYGPVCNGKVQQSLEARVTSSGERPIKYFSDEPAIACPWHGWEYYLSNGKHIGDPDISIPTFDVILRDDKIYIDL